MRRSLLVAVLIAAFVVGSFGSVFAYSSYLNTFNTKYSKSWDCGVCHNSTGGGGARNPYGNAFAAVSTHSSDPNGAYDTIASQPSVCSGNTYLQMITQGFYPGGHGSAVTCPAPAPVACTGYTYSAWSACSSSGQQTRTVTGNTPSGCTGTPSTAAVLTQACTPPPVACTGYNYSAWSACSSSGQQTRTVLNNTPSGCTGTPSTAAVLTQACTPAPVACTGYNYSAWSACGSNGQQTRTVLNNTPSGCTGIPSTAAVLTQACTYTAPTCTSFTYGAWSACQADNTQSRTVLTSSPSGCTGGSPVISQTCAYVPPPTGGVMALPTSGQTFTYKAVAAPVLSTDPAQAKPIGVGAVASGGNTFDIKVALDQFAGPVDVVFSIYASSIDPRHVFYYGSDRSIRRSYVVWKTTVSDFSDALFINEPVSSLPAGQYTLILQVSPAGQGGDDDYNSYYRWVTSLNIGGSDSHYDD